MTKFVQQFAAQLASADSQILADLRDFVDWQTQVATTARYLSALEASFIISRLSPYMGNRASRLIKSPKLYFADSGLACYLTGLNNIAPEVHEPFPGSMLETYIAQNIRSILDARWREARLYFWNVQGRHEVDFVIEAGRRCMALEVKAGARWEERDLAGLKAFLSATPHCFAAILGYNGPDAVQLSGKIWALPLSLLLS